jgi:outer membrane receptor protein involved in Fe transport
VTGALSEVTIESISAYSINRFEAWYDLSDPAGGLGGVGGAGYQVFGVTGYLEKEADKTSKFSQELRASGTVFSRLDWLLGLFYTHEDSPDTEIHYAAEPETGNTVGVMLTDHYPTSYTERAVFADLTLHFTDRFDVQIGGRQSHITQDYQESQSGPLLGLFGLPDPTNQPPVHDEANAFTYLLTPRFRFSNALMVYARLASGYRPGGPNATCNISGAPCHYEPDHTKNYEIGAKGVLGNDVFSYDASAYYIDWKDIQISLYTPQGYGYLENAASAKSQGLELSGQGRLFAGNTIDAWVVWNQAVLTSTLPPNGPVGVPGDRLPYSAPFSGNLSVEQEFPLSKLLTGDVGALLIYVGNREAEFVNPPPRTQLPAYTQLNLHTGLRRSNWRLTLYANNVTDKRGVVALSGTPPLFTNPVYIQPRTIGLSFTQTF